MPFTCRRPVPWLPEKNAKVNFFATAGFGVFFDACLGNPYMLFLKRKLECFFFKQKIDKKLDGILPCFFYFIFFGCSHLFPPFFVSGFRKASTFKALVQLVDGAFETFLQSS